MSDNYKHLVQDLKKFKTKFLFFKLFRGVLLLLSLLLTYFLIVLIIENFLFIKPEIKVYIFYITLLFALFILLWFLLIPTIKLLGIGENLSNKDIAGIIKNYIPELDDSLINTIELAENFNFNSSNELILASINQKIEKLKLFDFSAALTIQQLKRFIFRFLIVLTVFLLCLLFFKNEMISSAYRLVHYQSEFVKPAPFDFLLQNKDLTVRKGSGLKIELKMQGREIPDVVYISFGGNNFLMNKKDNIYLYEIENINNSFSFNFTANNYYSERYKIEVLPVPLIDNFSVEVNPPSYTDLKSESFSNVGNLKVPHGSIIKWKFKTFETSEIILTINDSIQLSSKDDKNEFVFEKKSLDNFKYSISLKNKNFTELNILNYSVEVIPDLFPQIEIAQIKDSTNYFRYYFKGNIDDDYGFSKLAFHVFFDRKDSIIELPFVKSLDQQDFYYTYDFSELKEDNRIVNYYFTVSDNDAVAGFKETSSESFIFNFPDFKERSDFDNSEFSTLEKLMDKSLKLNEEIKSGLNELKMDQINSELSDWDKQQKIKDIVEKRKSLEEVLNEISKRNKDLNNYNNSFSEEKKEIIEKQKQVENLLKEVFSDELKNLFDEFNKLASEFNAKKMNELTDNMDMQLDDLSKQLERNLETLKRMKVEQKVQSIIDELNAVSQKEKKLLSDFQKNKAFEDISTPQDELSKKLEFEREEYFQILEFNNELKKPLNLADFKLEFKEIGEEFSNNKQLIEKKKRKDFSKSSEMISQQIENLAFSIQQMLDANSKKQQGEDLDNLHQILDNLIYLSFFQERIYEQLKDIQKDDPLLKMIKIDQSKIIDQTVVVKDSLYALAERNTQISGVVNRELMNVKMNSEDALKMLEDARNYNALIYQQKTMTAFNNLALFLSEVIKKAEENLANSMPGDQECDKPGGKGKKQNMNMLKQSQEAIKKHMQQLIDKMKSGDLKGINQQIGQTLAQQEIMQQLIREMMGDSEVGSSAKEQLKMVDRLIEMNKSDLISKNISAQTVNRQSMILNKLLKAETADIERDDDNERESKTATDNFYSNPDLFFEYKQEKQKNEEEIIRNNYILEQYYNKKYKSYINNLDK